MFKRLTMVRVLALNVALPSPSQFKRLQFMFLKSWSILNGLHEHESRNFPMSNSIMDDSLFTGFAWYFILESVSLRLL